MLRRIGIAVLLLASATLATQTAQYGHHGAVLLPDSAMTPGKVRTADTKEVCSQTTEQFRNTTQKMKNQVYAAYGAQRNKGICAGGCEVDHLISLELGGADEIENLWPQPSQPKPGFHEKDALENWLHKQVCAGKMTLADAQKGIAQDWYWLYLEMEKQKAAAQARMIEPQWVQDYGDGHWSCPTGFHVPEVTYAGWICEPDKETHAP